MKKFKFVIIIVLLVTSCKKEGVLRFSGITERDINGELGRSIDNTDWRLDDVWSQKEEQLFDAKNFKSTGSLSPNLISESVCVAYPNPVYSTFQLLIQSTADSIMFLLVNNNYDILISQKQKSPGNYLMNINVDDRTKFKVNEIYRVYYKLLYKNGTIEKGHGDIQIKNL